jgi:hypothetical protein
VLEEVIAALRQESAFGLKLYLEHLIFERGDTVRQWLMGLMVEDVSASGIVVVVHYRRSLWDG